MEKNLKKFLLGGIILIILIIIFLNWESLKTILTRSAYDLKELKKEAIIDMDMGESGNFYPYESFLVLYNDEEVRLVSRDEREELLKLPREAREIVFGEEKFYLVDRENGKVKSYGEGARALEEFKLDKGIYRLVEKNNQFIGHFKEGDREVVKLLGANAEEIGAFTSDDYILTYDVRKKDYIVSLVKATNEIKSELHYIGEGNKEIWSKDFEDEVILSNIIVRDGKVLLQTDENIYFIDQGKIEWEKKIDDILDLKYIDGKIYILYYKSLESVDLDGETLFNISLEKKYEKIFGMGDYIFLGGRINILGIKDSEKILEFTSDREIEDIKNTGNNIFIKAGNDIIEYKIIGKQVEN